MKNRYYISEVGSTNAWLQQQLLEQDLPHGFCVCAAYQTAGRGQLTNTWESAAAQNILCSLLLKPQQFPVKQQFLISQAVALGVVDFLGQYAPDFCIKWPNDIYWHDKKIAGILIENNLQGAFIATCVVVIGLNINQTAFVSDAPNPISLSQITGQQYSLEEAREQLHRSILVRYEQVLTDPAQLQQDYLSVLYRYQTWASYQDEKGQFEGRIVAVEPMGYLHIEDREGIDRKYAFKEVQFLLP